MEHAKSRDTALLRRVLEKVSSKKSVLQKWLEDGTAKHFMPTAIVDLMRRSGVSFDHIKDYLASLDDANYGSVLMRIFGPYHQRFTRNNKMWAGCILRLHRSSQLPKFIKAHCRKFSPEALHTCATTLIKLDSATDEQIPEAFGLLMPRMFSASSEIDTDLQDKMMLRSPSFHGLGRWLDRLYRSRLETEVASTHLSPPDFALDLANSTELPSISALRQPARSERHQPQFPNAIGIDVGDTQLSKEEQESILRHLVNAMSLRQLRKNTENCLRAIGACERLQDELEIHPEVRWYGNKSLCEKLLETRSHLLIFGLTRRMKALPSSKDEDTVDLLERACNPHVLNEIIDQLPTSRTGVFNTLDAAAKSPQLNKSRRHRFATAMLRGSCRNGLDKAFLQLMIHSLTTSPQALLADWTDLNDEQRQVLIDWLIHYETCNVWFGKEQPEIATRWHLNMMFTWAGRDTQRRQDVGLLQFCRGGLFQELKPIEVKSICNRLVDPNLFDLSEFTKPAGIIPMVVASAQNGAEAYRITETLAILFESLYDHDDGKWIKLLFTGIDKILGIQERSRLRLTIKEIIEDRIATNLNRGRMPSQQLAEILVNKYLIPDSKIWTQLTPKGKCAAKATRLSFLHFKSAKKPRIKE